MSKEFEILSSVLNLRDELGENFEEFEVENTLQLISKFVDSSGGLTSRQKTLIEQALDIPNAFTKADLKKHWEKIQSEIEGKVPEKLRPLIKPLNSFSIGKPGIVSWPYEFAEKNLPLPKSLKGGKFDFEIESDLSFKAYPSPPQNVINAVSSDYGVIAVAASASIKTAASTSMPIKFGSLGLNTAGEGALSSLHYYQHESDQYFGKALLADLGKLVSQQKPPFPIPFSRNSIAQQFIPHPNLRLTTYKGYGKMKFGGNISFNSPSPMLGDLVNSIGVDLKSEIGIGGEFEVLISKSTSTPQIVNIRIDNRHSRSSTMSADIGMEFDLTERMVKVHEVLSEGLEELKKLIEQLEVEWSLTREFTELVKKELVAVSNDEHWIAFVDGTLSEASSNAFLAHAKSEITDKIDVTGERVKQKLANELKDFLSYGFSKIENSEIQDHIEGLLGSIDFEEWALEKSQELVMIRAKEFIDSLVKDTKRVVKGVITDRVQLDVFTPIVKKLTKVDKKIADVQEKAVAILSPYVKKLETLTKAAEVLSENQVKTTINLLRSVETGAATVVDADFGLGACVKHSDAIDDLLIGSPDDVVALFQQNAQGVILNECVLSEFTKSSRSAGINFVVLSFEMSAKTLLNSEVSFRLDPVAGVLHVSSKNEIEKSRALLGDSRSIRFINVSQLSTARDTGRGAISLSLNRREEELESGELQVFLNSFAKGGLITEDQVNLAMQRAFSNSSTGQMVEDAEITSGLRWNAQKLEQLFANAASMDEQAIIQVVAEAVNDYDIYDAAQIREAAQGLDMLYSAGETTAGDLVEYLATKEGHRKYSRYTRPNGSVDPSQRNWARTTYAPFRSWVEKGRDLAKALEKMSDVYESQGNWSKDKYRKAGESINKELCSWVKEAGLFEMAAARLFRRVNTDDEVKLPVLMLITVLDKLSTSREDARSALAMAMITGEGTNQTIIDLI